MNNWKKLALLGLSALTLAACGSDSEEQATESASESALVESSSEIEVMTAADFVDEHEGENIDMIIADFNALTDEAMKMQLNEQIADSDTTMFGKKVEVTGTAVEFVEGSDGMSKGSFIVMTDGGNRVRIAARTPNEALDINEKVEVTGLLGMPLQSDDILVREASVYIQ